MLRDAVTRLRKSTFFKNVLTMFSGTVIAQVIPLAMAPVLTRLYLPEQYGEYALFILVAYTVSALASLRYEFAVMLPDEEGDAASIVALCLVLACIVSCVAALGGLALPIFGDRGGAVVRLARHGHLLGVMVLLQSVYQTLNYWILRKQAFFQLSASRVFRAVAMAFGNVLFGLLKKPDGLILSGILGQFVATAVLGGYIVRKDWRAFLGVRRVRMLALAKQHRHFPLFALPSDLLSTVSQQLPVVLLPAATGGSFSFVQNVVNAPLNFVSGAVLDAFKERASRDYRERGEFRGIFVVLFRSLALLSVIPFVVLIFFAPSLFAFVFGESWRAAGECARILAPAMMFKFVVSPLSYSYYIVGRQKEDFVLHVGIMLAVAGSLGAGMYAFQSASIALVFFSGVYVIIYLVYLARSYRFARGLR